jgi:NAD-reducing hydrogenase large subunit
VTREIVIEPVTRIEGHAKITIQLDDHGQVADAHFHVTQFRGFERICQGRPVHELPSIMARICGICPVSHLIASAKACDQILATEPPPTGAALRRILNLAQVVQSHALSFFHLSSPDLLFGFDAEAGGRHLFGVLEANPRLARDGVGLRRFGQQVIESIGGKRIHPAGVVPGGMAAPLQPETRAQILAALPEALTATQRALDWYKTSVRRFEEEAARFGDFPSAFMGLVGPDGAVEHYDGALRVVGADGAVLAERPDPRPTGSTWARRSSPGRTSSRPTGRTSATPTASTGSAPWPASTSPTRWVPPRPTRSWRSSAAGWVAPRRVPSTTTRPA